MKTMNELLSIFGYQAFRPLQKEAIESLLQGEDVLLISPTGGGKSLVYQIPAIMLEGVAIVVCPLLALMSQQVEQLKRLGVKAEFLNSTLNPGEQDDLVWALRHKKVDLLFLSPEKLAQPSVLGVLSHVKIAFFAVDEAHCITQWGNDFRPEYGALRFIRDGFLNIPIIAMSGTADQSTQNDIIQSLKLTQPSKYIRSFNRENIEVTISQKKLAKQQIRHFLLNEVLGWSGIIYCRSRKRVEEVSQWLNSTGIESLFFHANLESSKKSENLTRFTKENGLVMVATSAFGMGIDIKSVRFVIHMDLPSSIESYYQEIGRAGRDGQVAKSLLLYGLQDYLKLLQFSLEEGQNERTQTDMFNFFRLLEQRGCRKKAIMSHFSESIEECERCDRCLQQQKEQNVTMAAQKILSLIHHTRGVVGTSTLIHILLGKKTKTVTEIEGQKLALFGQGTELTEVNWKTVIRYLIAQEYLSFCQFSPLQIMLTNKSRQILRGEEQVVICEDFHVNGDDKKLLSQEDYDLRRGLLKWYHSSNCGAEITLGQLELIIQHRPKNLAAMSRLTGIGMDVLHDIGSPILSLLSSQSRA